MLPHVVILKVSPKSLFPLGNGGLLPAAPSLYSQHSLSSPESHKKLYNAIMLEEIYGNPYVQFLYKKDLYLCMYYIPFNRAVQCISLFFIRVILYIYTVYNMYVFMNIKDVYIFH